jgi:hypothetical protein
MSLPKNHEQVLDFAEQGIIEDGDLVMPTLYSLDTHGKYHVWTVLIGIKDAKDKQIPVTQDYIDREELPEGAYAVTWTISGRENMKQTVSDKTVCYEGKNLGKKNYTTAFTQSIYDARSLFNKKIRQGQKLDKQALKRPGDIYTIEELAEDDTRGEYPWRVFAMSLHDYKKFPKKIHFSAAVQYKLDGILLIVVHHPVLPAIAVIDLDGKTKKLKIDCYSRSRETYEGQDQMLLELYPIAQKYPGLHFVGELWKEGYGLQDISGSARRKTDSKAKTERVILNFNIFDCFYIDQPDLTFQERQYVLDDVFLDIEPEMITRIPTLEVKNVTELKSIYQGYLAKGYEGAVVRNWNAKYEFGINKEIRSYDTMKIKPRPDSEWPIVGFEEGNGKETGAIKWVCAENDEGVKKRTGELLPLEERKTFRVTPNQPTDVRKTIFAKYTAHSDWFKEQVYGQLATISYSILSNTFMPQQPKMLRFRNPEVDTLVRSE